jgi:hypothetical protein
MLQKRRSRKSPDLHIGDLPDIGFAPISIRYSEPSARYHRYNGDPNKVVERLGRIETK